MAVSVVKVGVIGPTDIKRLAMLTGRREEFLLAKAGQVGKIIAQSGCELWINSDGGMLAAVAESYKIHGGKSLVMLLPLPPGDPWPVAHGEAYLAMADRVIRPSDWYRANHLVVSEPETVVCVGLSGGTNTELGYIKWDVRWRLGNLATLIGVRELLRGGKIAPEEEPGVKSVLRYIETTDELTDVLAEMGCIKELLPA